MRQAVKILFWLVSGASLSALAHCQTFDTSAQGWLHGLRKDPHLATSVSFNFSVSPTAAQVLATIQEATGVKMKLAEQPEKGEVAFGGTAIINVPAWKVMQQIAATQFADGKWEKAGAGYVLRGRARLVIDPETQKQQAAEKNASDQAAAEREKALKKFPLRRDARLSVAISVTADDPKLRELFGRLAEATGLTFALAENLAHHDPRFGNLALPAAPACIVMEMIAQKDLVDGRWEKTGTGYRLEGVSTRNSTGTSLLTWLVLGLALGLIGAALFLLLRKHPSAKRDAASHKMAGK